MSGIKANPLELYKIARWAYSVGSPIMSDAEYDALQVALYGTQVAAQEHSYDTEKCPIDLLKKYNMMSLAEDVVLTGEKSKSIVSIKTEKDATRYYEERENRSYLLAYKMDGWNTQPRYLDGHLVTTQSRGRSTNAINLDTLSPYLPQTVGELGNVRVYGEATLSTENLKKLKRLFPSKNYEYARASVRGAFVNAPELLTFMAFDVDFDGSDYYDVYGKYMLLQKWGFQVPPFRTAKGDGVVEAVKEMSDTRDASLSSDGIVVTGLGSALVEDVRALRLYTWANPVYISRVVGYEESYGTQYIGIKLRIEPVETPTGVQRLIDIDNTRRIQEHGLKPGAYVVFEKVSSAVEHINVHLTALANRGEIVL